jgi:putative transposase
MASIAQAKKARIIEINSRPDHIHSLVSMPSTITIGDLVNALKANSTRWIHETFPNRSQFAWQEGYAAFSVSKSVVPAVVEYIRNQEEHHKRRDFKEELLRLLDLHGTEYDPRFIFD